VQISNSVDSYPFADAPFPCQGKQGNGTKRSRFRVGGRGVLRRLRPALFNADPKPNFHYDNDRKLEAEIQGYEAVYFLSLTIKIKNEQRIFESGEIE
jgi:hypothetical protein